MFLAFDNGLGFYQAFSLYVTSGIYALKLQQKKYYCRLFLKYGSKTNNNFIPLNLDKETVTVENYFNVNSVHPR